MKRDQVESRLLDVHARLVRARQELAVVEEQLDVFLETAEETRIRSLVSETPLADRDWQDAQRHAEAMMRARDTASARVVELEQAQDELLGKLVV
ncbi:MAG: hypothetical protein ABSD85_06545 [Acidimicrobiales bacterium]|jgi:hypothetical protein